MEEKKIVSRRRGMMSTSGGSIVLSLTQECELLGMKNGDEVQITVVDDNIVIEKIEKV